jgi:hypothetical protein
LLLAAALATQIANAHPPPPTITFKGLDKKGCKVFEISDKDTVRGIEQPGVISRVDVVPEAGTMKSPDSTGAFAQTFEDGAHRFTYAPAPETVTITVCEKKKSDLGQFDFRVVARDGQDPPEQQTMAVRERASIPDFEGRFIAGFNIFKEHSDAECAKAKAGVKVDDNVELDAGFPTCDRTEAGFVHVQVRGKLKDPTKPGMAWLVYDPPAELHLVVFDVCVPEGKKAICPGGIKLKVED